MLAHKGLGACLALMVLLTQTPAWPSESAHRYDFFSAGPGSGPGQPPSVVFVDIGGVRRRAGASKVDMMVVMSKPQMIDGHDVIRIVYHSDVRCAEGVVRTPVATGVLAGGGTYDQPSGAPWRPARSDIDRQLVRWACDPAAKEGPAFASLDGALGYAAEAERMSRALDPQAHRRFWLVDGVNGLPGGAMDAFIDLDGVSHDGDTVTYPLLMVSQHPVTSSSRPGPYDFVLKKADCKARTALALFVRRFGPDGQEREYVFGGAGGGPTKAGSLGEAELSFVCEGPPAQFLTPPTASVADAVRQAVVSLRSPDRH